MGDTKGHERDTSADARRRWEEVQRMREQVLNRQDQVIQQTSAEVRRHVERMRHVRSTLVSVDTSSHRKSAPTVAVETSDPTPLFEVVGVVDARPTRPAPQRFDFDARRAEWEQRRRERADARHAEMQRRVEPYQEYRRQLEEKRRQALAQQANPSNRHGHNPAGRPK